MDLKLFVLLLFSLQVLYWFIGNRASKNLQGKEDYFLAGKTVKLFPLMMTFLATQVGGGLVLGAADEAYHFGWSVLLYPLGASLGLIALGAGIGRKLSEFKVSTVAEIFEVVYKSPLLKKIASILSVISLFMILVAQVIASHKFLVSLGFNNTALFLSFWAIVILYTTQGGLKAVISTDIAQASFFSIVFLGCFGFSIFSNPTLLDIPQISNLTLVPSKLCGWLFMPLLFMMIEQDMGQRCFAGGSGKIVSKASFFAGIGTMILCVIPVFFGVLAKNLNLIIPKGSSVLMTVIAKTTTPWITALVGCAILAAIISTATSLMSAISSNLASDFKMPSLYKKQPLFLAKAITCFISIFAIFCAFYFDNIVDLLIQSYELSVSCLFIPIFLAFFKKQGDFLSALLAFIFGGLAFCLFRIYPMTFPKEILSVLCSLMGYGCGYLIAKARKSTSHIKLS